MDFAKEMETMITEDLYKRIWMVANVLRQMAIAVIIKALFYIIMSIALTYIMIKAISRITAMIMRIFGPLENNTSKRYAEKIGDWEKDFTIKNPIRESVAENVKIFYIDDDIVFRQIQKRDDLNKFVVENHEREDIITKLTEIGLQNFIINDISMVPEWYQQYIMYFGNKPESHKQKRSDLLAGRTAYVIGNNQLTYIFDVLKTHIMSKSPFAFDKIYKRK